MDMEDGEGFEPVELVVSAEATLKLLAEGNSRFRSGMPLGLNRTSTRREEVASGQKPFAAVVGCSDSRVPPEILFDVGLGDLFVVRAAGNVLDEAGLGSLEYAVENLGVRLILVLGHTDCGALRAALAGTRTAGHLSWIMGALEPAVRGTAGAADQVGLCTLANISWAVYKVQTAGPVLSELCGSGRLAVRGALYDLRTGEVRFLPEEGMETF